MGSGKIQFCAHRFYASFVELVRRLDADQCPNGTQVVSRKEVMAAGNESIAHPARAVGVVIQWPVNRDHA